VAAVLIALNHFEGLRKLPGYAVRVLPEDAWSRLSQFDNFFRCLFRHSISTPFSAEPLQQLAANSDKPAPNLANHGRVKSFGFTIMNSRSVTKRLAAHAQTRTKTPVTSGHHLLDPAAPARRYRVGRFTTGSKPLAEGRWPRGSQGERGRSKPLAEGLPTLSIITGTTGWFPPSRARGNDHPWPQFGWVAAALALVVLMTIQGLGYLLPTNLWVCIQLRQPDPDFAKISRVMRNYFFAVATQGTMQILTIVIMARFVTGL
jgi:hypothetical protein